MSLKAFHIFFICASVLLAVAVGAWGIQSFLAGGGPSGLWLGGVFFVAGFVLVLYGIRFFGKLKELGGR
jgi:hypothetical protein